MGRENSNISQTNRIAKIARKLKVDIFDDHTIRENDSGVLEKSSIVHISKKEKGNINARHQAERILARSTYVIVAWLM